MKECFADGFCCVCVFEVERNRTERDEQRGTHLEERIPCCSGAAQENHKNSFSGFGNFPITRTTRFQNKKNVLVGPVSPRYSKFEGALVFQVGVRGMKPRERHLRIKIRGISIIPQV
jgi:hypothetical protein